MANQLLSSKHRKKSHFYHNFQFSRKHFFASRHRIFCVWPPENCAPNGEIAKKKCELLLLLSLLFIFFYCSLFHFAGWLLFVLSHIRRSHYTAQNSKFFKIIIIYVCVFLSFFFGWTYCRQRSHRIVHIDRSGIQTLARSIRRRHSIGTKQRERRKKRVENLICWTRTVGRYRHDDPIHIEQTEWFGKGKTWRNLAIS